MSTHRTPVATIGFTKSTAERFFERLIGEPSLAGKIWTIHSRRADRDVIDRLRHRAIKMTPILHWFTGPVTLIQSAVDAGCYFSVNAAMLAGPKASALMTALPRERVLVETDAPYSRVGSRSSEPSDVPATVHRLASFWGTSENNRRARYYRLTPKGRKQLETQTNRWDELVRAVNRILRPASE